MTRWPLWVRVGCVVAVVAAGSVVGWLLGRQPGESLLLGCVCSWIALGPPVKKIEAANRLRLARRVTAGLPEFEGSDDEKRLATLRELDRVYRRTGIHDLRLVILLVVSLHVVVLLAIMLSSAAQDTLRDWLPLSPWLADFAAVAWVGMAALGCLCLVLRGLSELSLRSYRLLLARHLAGIVPVCDGCRYELLGLQLDRDNGVVCPECGRRKQFFLGTAALERMVAASPRSSSSPEVAR